MAKKRKGKKINGWLNLYKHTGITSVKAMAEARRIFDANKAGHGGTLDPFAAGILPIAFGEATKTVNYVMDTIKQYQFIVKWGSETDSCDCDGDVINTHDHRPTKTDIENILPNFIGTIKQTPPQYSAIKINGQRAYALARQQIEIDMPQRDVDIYALTIDDMIDTDHSEFTVICGKGTYVRALARDIGRMLGTYGHLQALERTNLGSFDVNNAFSLEDLSKMAHKGEHYRILMPIDFVLDGIPDIALDSHQAAMLRNGRALSFISRYDRQCIADIIDINDNKQIILAKTGNDAIGLCRFNKHKLYPLKIFNLGY